MRTDAQLVITKLGADCALLELFGRWEGDEAAEAMAAALRSTLRERRHGLINLARCDHMDRATIQAILSAGRSFDLAGDLDLLLFAASEPLREVVESELREEASAQAGGPGRL